MYNIHTRVRARLRVATIYSMPSYTSKIKKVFLYNMNLNIYIFSLNHSLNKTFKEFFIKKGDSRDENTLLYIEINER